MTDILAVGLSSWIIQDGNYGDFARDANAAFALEFYASPSLEEVEPDPSRAPSLTHVGDANYDVLGQVVHVADDWWGLNGGVLVFREERPPTNARPPTRLRRPIHLPTHPFSH